MRRQSKVVLHRSEALFRLLQIDHVAAMLFGDAQKLACRVVCSDKVSFLSEKSEEIEVRKAVVVFETLSPVNGQVLLEERFGFFEGVQLFEGEACAGEEVRKRFFFFWQFLQILSGFYYNF